MLFEEPLPAVPIPEAKAGGDVAISCVVLSTEMRRGD